MWMRLGQTGESSGTPLGGVGNPLWALGPSFHEKKVNNNNEGGERSQGRATMGQILTPSPRGE